MNVRALTRLTNAALVVAIGMGSAHLLMPVRATASALSRGVFVMSMAGTGALVAWRERRGRELDGDEHIAGAQRLWLLAGSVAMLALAWVAYRIAHR